MATSMNRHGVQVIGPGIVAASGKLRKAVLMVSADGKQLEQDPLPSLSLDVGKAGNVWVVMDTEVVKLDAKGKVLARSPLRGRTSQAWIATVR